MGAVQETGQEGTVVFKPEQPFGKPGFNDFETHPLLFSPLDDQEKATVLWAFDQRMKLMDANDGHPMANDTKALFNRMFLMSDFNGVKLPFLAAVIDYSPDPLVRKFSQERRKCRDVLINAAGEDMQDLIRGAGAISWFVMDQEDDRMAEILLGDISFMRKKKIALQAYIHAMQEQKP